MSTIVSVGSGPYSIVELGLEQATRFCANMLLTGGGVVLTCFDAAVCAARTATVLPMLAGVGRHVQLPYSRCRILYPLVCL